MCKGKDYMKSCIVYLPSVVYLRDWSFFYADAFDKCGYDVSFIPLLDRENLLQNVNDALAKKPSFILSIYAESFDYSSNDKSFYDTLQIPLLAICIDHPSIDIEKFQTLKSRFVFWGLYDRADTDYALKYIDSDKNYFYAPNAGFSSSSPLVPFNERDYDITFCGSIVDCEACRKMWDDFKNSHVKAFCEGAVELLLSDDAKSVSEAIAEVMRSRDYLSFYPKGKTFHFLAKAISFYVRGYRRVALLKQLAEQGLKIHCFGRKNDFFRLDHPNLVINDFLGTSDYLEVLSRSKIVINTSPMSRYAATERLLSAMLNGAAVVTDVNDFLVDNFTENENFIGFSHLDYKALGDKLSQLLGSRDLLADIASSGKEAAEKNHTVMHRAEKLIEVAETGRQLLM